MIEDKLGRQLRDLRISLTDRCNFRCAYCMPTDVYDRQWKFASAEALLGDDEVVRLAALGVKLGASRLRLTGGEPLLRAGAVQLVERLRNLKGVQELSLTTNGWFLASMAGDLQQAGLDRVTVSLDSLDEGLFRRLSGIGSKKEGVARVLKGIEAAQAVGLSPVKVNAVIQRGINEGQVEALAEKFRGTGIVLRLIEYMDVGGCDGWQPNQVLKAAEMLQLLHHRWPLRLLGKRRGRPARRYRYADGQGEVGIIASITRPFCGSCTRARLSAEGGMVHMFVCPCRIGFAHSYAWRCLR